MHELAVTESILEIALRHARERNATRITGLNLVLGQWSSIVDDSVQFYWDTISDGTIAKGAQLHFRRVPVRLTCRTCENEYAPAGELLACPQCGGTDVKVIAGEEFQLEAIDIETGSE
jgi:hydrogenase nickel incorporation protein HypA/HybF